MVVSRRGFLALLSSVEAPNRIDARASTALTALGRLTPFYRSTQLQGHLIGMGLMEIPDYLLQGDLQYRTKPQMVRELPFVDSFTINRFLGGYREDWLERYHLWDERLGRRSLDYVIRRSDGSLQFRPELIAARLRPYLEAGYRAGDITIALENIPWDLAQQNGAGNEGPWGQDEPPADMREWSRVIAQFARDLQAYLGPSGADVGFKTGVEYDEKVSFNTSADEFYRYYAATDAGLHAVLPGAKLSPGEFTGLGVCDEPAVAHCVYDTQQFLDYATKHGLTVSYVPRSLHSVLNRPNPMPSAAVDRAKRSFARLPGVVTEIHQFGLLGQPFSAGLGADPAALQANWQFQTLMQLWESVRPRRVFHWGVFVEVGKLKFLNGAGFLRLVLDQHVGHQAFRLSAKEERATDTAAARAEILAIAFVGPRSSGLVISSFSPAATGQTRTVVTTVPPGLLHGNALRTIRYRASDNVFARIRRDLDSEGNLKPQFVASPGYTSDPIDMAIDAGRARTMLLRNWPRYASALEQSLRWRMQDEGVALQGTELRTKLEPNEMLVLDSSAD